MPQEDTSFQLEQTDAVQHLSQTPKHCNDDKDTHVRPADTHKYTLLAVTKGLTLNNTLKTEGSVCHMSVTVDVVQNNIRKEPHMFLPTPNY
jgi:hypothetical protein